MLVEDLLLTNSLSNSAYLSTLLMNPTVGNLLVIYNQSTNPTVVNEQILTVDETQTIPSVHVPKDHYLIMYDLNPSTNPSRVHWLQYNGQTLWPYEGPAPPTDTGMHQYVFILCNGIPPYLPSQRYYFNPNPYFKHVVSKTYFLAKVADTE